MHIFVIHRQCHNAVAAVLRFHSQDNRIFLANICNHLHLIRFQGRSRNTPIGIHRNRHLTIIVSSISVTIQTQIQHIRTLTRRVHCQRQVGYRINSDSIQGQLTRELIISASSCHHIIEWLTFPFQMFCQTSPGPIITIFSFTHIEFLYAFHEQIHGND